MVAALAVRPPALTPDSTGGALSTVTLTAAEVAALPAASLATAVKLWLPFALKAVFQETEYGATVSSTPRIAPSSLNCTPTTPTLSVALAATVTVPATVAPGLGEVTLTVGGVVSGGGGGGAPPSNWKVPLTRMVPELPRESWAETSSVYVPAGAFRSDPLKTESPAARSGYTPLSASGTVSVMSGSLWKKTVAVSTALPSCTST